MTPRWPSVALALLCGLLSLATSIANEATSDSNQIHWLMGRWEGELEGVPAPQGRFVEVWAVAPDGTAQGVMGISGEQHPGRTEITVDGVHVHLVNGIGSVVELTREGDDRLAGTLVGRGGGRILRLQLTREQQPQDRGVSGQVVSKQLIGRWEGSIEYSVITSANPRRTLYIHSVNHTDSQWIARGAHGLTGKELAPVRIEVLVETIGNPPWIRFLTPESRPSVVRLQLFKDKHLIGTIRLPGPSDRIQWSQPTMHLERIE